MSIHTRRWLECDFPGCLATFEWDRYRSVVLSSDGATRGVRDAADRVGWSVTVDGDDLCLHHTDVHRGRPSQSPLFPVPDGDHAE